MPVASSGYIGTSLAIPPSGSFDLLGAKDPSL